MASNQKRFKNSNLTPSMTGMLTDIRERGIAKTNRFSMFIPTPVGMEHTMPNDMVESFRWSQFSIEATQIPGFMVATQENYIYHIVQKMPYMVNFDEIQLSIRCDAMYTERRFFEKWKNLMKNPKTGDIRYKSDYTVDLHIEQLDDAGNVIFGVIILNAFPIQLGDIDLQSQNADVNRMNVSFAFDKYITYEDLNWDAVLKALDIKGNEEYKKYQTRGPSAAQLLRHAANASNFARDTVRNAIQGGLGL